jgi:sphingolipid 4-desaturase/C4-monooxygenase
MGHDPMMKYKVFFGLFVQYLSLELLHGNNNQENSNLKASWWTWFVCCYTLGGMVTGSMTLALHELSHNLASKGRMWNRVIAMMANATLGIPAAATFKRYHAEHHKFLGEHTVDVDIPTYFEGRVFGSSSLGKAIWLLLQPLWYGLRPMVINTKDPNAYEIINICVIVFIDALVYWRYGIQGVFYLLLSTILGMQWHPVAGHFIAEHYIFQDGQETYSYYGPFNWIGFNVGYHIEHHDLPFVASSRLPTLRRIASSFYDHPHYHSWVKVLWDFVLDSNLSPYARMKRHELSPTELEELKTRGGLSSN